MPVRIPAGLLIHCFLPDILPIFYYLMKKK